MPSSRLVLSLPFGALTATSLDVAGYAYHKRPGSGKHFQGRTVLAELRPMGEFEFLDEGGWRDAAGDAKLALAATDGGKKTKTALSNYAFVCTPISALAKMYLGKTGGEVLPLVDPTPLATFTQHACHEAMTPAEVAAAIGQPGPASRVPRLYLVLAPVEFLVLSSLTPAEYAWYATHRPGKLFRQLLFTELHADPTHLVSQGKFESSRDELAKNPAKKTKTVVNGDIYNNIPFEGWVGYDRQEVGGLYIGDRDAATLWQFPKEIPRTWERAY